MAEQWSRLSSAVRWMLLILGVVVPSAVACLIAYVVHPEFREWVRSLKEPPHLVARVGRPLRGLRQWWRVVFAAVVLVLVAYVVWNRPEVWRVGLIAAAAFLLWWFRREVGTGISWLHRGVLWKAIIRPAREEFGVEASNEAFDPGVKFTEELRPVLRELDDESLTLLGRALDRRKPGSREAFMEWPELRVEADAVDWPEEVKRLHEACERLRDVGAIEMWVGGTNMSERFPDLRVRFPVRGWSALERLRVLVEVELARRELVEGAAAPVSGCKEKIRDLSGHGVSVLEYLLRLYRTCAGSVIQEDLSDPEIPMSPLKSLPRARLQAALDELVHEGFLEEYKWNGETLQARVTECLSKRSVADVVFKWLQDLMVEGR